MSTFGVRLSGLRKLLPALPAGFAVMAGCSAQGPGPAGAEPVGADDSSLLGAVNYGADCNANDKSFLDKVMHYGRTAAASNASAQCIQGAMTARQADFIGPYMPCVGDPFYSASSAVQLDKVLQAARSTVDTTISCTGGMAGSNASAAIDAYGHLTPESLSFADWLRSVETGIDSPPCVANGSGPCRFAPDPWPWSQAAGIIWHEAMHQHGYTHGANDQPNAKINCGYSSLTDGQWNFQTNTMPYIVGNCIGQVIGESGNVCGAPLENGTGLDLVTSLGSGSCAKVDDPQSATVSWTRIDTNPYIAKIAACDDGDGRVYVRNKDHSLWVSHDSGRAGSFSYMQTNTYADQIFCANNKLWVVNSDRSLWRNDGTDNAVQWIRIGRPASARRVTGTTSWRVDYPYAAFPYPILYALNDDNTVWKSLTGADDSWTYVSTNPYLQLIAAGGGLLEARPFGLNYDNSFWLNAGDGCGAYWHPLGTLGAAVDIAAATSKSLYLLNSDSSLWKGTINGSDLLTTVALGKARHCDGSRLVPN